MTELTRRLRSCPQSKSGLLQTTQRLPLIDRLANPRSELSRQCGQRQRLRLLREYSPMSLSLNTLCALDGKIPLPDRARTPVQIKDLCITGSEYVRGSAAVQRQRSANRGAPTAWLRVAGDCPGAALSSVFPGSELEHEFSRRDDSEVSEASISRKREEVDVAGDQDICISVHCGGEQVIVVRIAGSDDRVDFPVDPNGVNCEQMEEEPCIEAAKFLWPLCARFGEHTVIFAINALRDNERKAAGMPQVQNLERRTGSSQHPAYNDVGIENDARTPRARHVARCELGRRGGRLLQRFRPQ